MVFITLPLPLGLRVPLLLRDEVGGTYVMRDGRLVRGTGETQGVRATDGSVSFEDARARNMADMQRMNFGRKQDLSALRPLI